jgi:hypothetical protein
MKLCIFDPAHNVPGLKILFPESDYYAIEPSEFFTYTAINHMNNEDFYKLYNFKYETNINSINSNNYDTLFIVLPFLDCIEGHSMTKDYGVRILRLVEHILEMNSFINVSVFDTYDYDYDPTTIYNNPKINCYFKRNYNKTKKYSSNVSPFPYTMFVTPCVLTITLQDNTSIDLNNRKNGIFWCGTIFTHENREFDIFRDRQTIYNEIKNTLSIYNNLSHKEFINTLQEYKFGLDLYGVGDPNKRTFELLANDVLIITNRKDLEWGFNNGDYFSPETIFSNLQEYYDNLKSLMNEEIYMKCLNNQRFLKKKYFNKEWLRNYILNKITNNI